MLRSTVYFSSPARISEQGFLTPLEYILGVPHRQKDVSHCYKASQNWNRITDIASIVWRVRVQVELGPNNNYNLFSSDLCDVRSKTESFYKVYKHIQFNIINKYMDRT